MTDMTEKMRDMLKEEVKANIILKVEDIKIMEMAFIRMIILFQILFGQIKMVGFHIVCNKNMQCWQSW